MAKKGRPATYQSDEDKPVTISMRVPKELHTRLERYAKQHRQSISELMRDGIEWRIGDGDPRGLGDGAGTHNPQEYYGNTESMKEAQAAEALQEVRTLLRQQWEQIQTLAQALERQTTGEGNGLYDSNTARVPENPVLPAPPVPDGNDEQRETITASPENNYYEQIETIPDQSNTVIQAAEPKHRGRKPVLRPGILALLHEHPDGLTAAELKVYLKTEKPIGDTLAGMVKAQLLARNGSGQGLRYQRATPEAKRQEVSA
jgi:hypothetical protein